jgi:Mn-dependent DtxR family transcriptional regulator
MVNREQDGTSALDRYLLIIGETLEKGERPRVRDIAKRLEVSKPAVTAALRGLGQKGLVMYQPYAPYHLDRERGRNGCRRSLSSRSPW